MKKIITILFFSAGLLLLANAGWAQENLFAKNEDCVTITFQPRVAYVESLFDSIVIRNKTQNNTYKTLIYPNHVLSNCPLEIEDFLFNDEIIVNQILTDPFSEKIKVTVSLPQNGKTTLSLLNLSGKICYSCTLNLQKGTHTLEVQTGSSGVFLLNVHNGKYFKIAKLLSYNSHSTKCNISLLSSGASKYDQFSNNVFFDKGDKLYATAYLTQNGETHHSPLSLFCYADNDGIFLLDIPMTDTTSIPSLNGLHIEILNYNSSNTFYPVNSVNDIAYSVTFYDSTFYSSIINPIDDYELDGWRISGWKKYKTATVNNELEEGVQLYICNMDECLLNAEMTHYIRKVYHTGKLSIHKLGWHYDSDYVGISPIRIVQ